MSGLRDRIAAVLYRRDGFFGAFDDAFDFIMADYRATADAVIAELGMREEMRQRSYGRWILPAMDRTQRRWVTEWRTDNE